MQTTNIQPITLSFKQAKTYAVASLFIVGNIVLPQLCHLIPQGGLRWLPIYFFTLTGAFLYGRNVGLLTALISPVVNSLLFGMPAAESLPSILLKSVLLAVLAGYAASHFRRANLLVLAGIVLGYQALGTLGEWALKGDLYVALQDFRIGIPGMLVQIFGGWLFINLLAPRLRK
ncbi:MAG: ECF transporter S component [Bacteroidales bacterium]|nr:ECF transporter S component [Bacteroidales bacterium]